jgi:hypothetical protein
MRTMVDERCRKRAGGRGLPAKVLMAAMTAVALGACRAEEKGRPLEFQPGHYRGMPDEPLTPEQREALRQRSNLGH